MTDSWTRFITDPAPTEDGALTAIHDAALLTELPASESMARRLSEKSVPIGLAFLHARALAAEGQEDAAHAAFLSLAERLNQAGWLRAMARVLSEVLPQRPAEAAPLLARARQLGGPEAVSDELLFEAHRLHPRHGFLTWLAALAQTAAGKEQAALRLAGQALPELVAEKNYDTAEMAMLLLAEGDGSGSPPEMTRALELLARQEAWPVFENAIGLLGARLAEPSGALEAWPVIREIWRKHPDRTELRPVALRIVRGYLAARYPDPDAILRLSEIERPSQPVPAVLERLEKGERFPPGFYARHSGWGLGLIRENDAQVVVVDFPTKPLHRMSLATAEQALEALAPDDFRVLLVRDPAELKRLAEGDPGTLVLKVLGTIKQHRATGDEIRKQLVPSVLTSAAWPSWWKATRAQLDRDPRVDSRQAYANVWAIAERSDEVERAPVPPWQHDKDAMKNLAMLEDFLAQHPEEVPEVLNAHHDRIEALARGKRAAAEQAVAAGLWLLRVQPEVSIAPEAHVGTQFDMNALSRRDQEELLPRLKAPDALGAALNSRLASVRRGAREALRREASEAKVLRDVLLRAHEAPEAALDILETESPEAPGTGWTYVAVLAALDLLERPPREAHRKRAQALFEAGSPLAALLGNAPLEEDERASVGSRLARWQSSDRYRFPALDFLRAVGHGDVADRVEGARARAAAKVSSRLGDEEEGYDQMLLLTRPTLERLQAERQRIGLELKTVIPQAIQKARELGDLRENAEYAAAKAKQAVYAKRFEELEALQNRARLIENLKREPGVGAPGTEIKLEEVDGLRTWTYWLLGEGDQDLGNTVVSYLALLGKLLMGRRAGDRLELPAEGDRILCRVVSVTERLP